MKKVHFIILFCLLMTSGIRASDTETESESDSCDELVEVFDDYLACIPKHLGCECCQWWHAFFDTKEYRYVGQQTEALKNIRAQISAGTITLGNVLLSLNDGLLPYEDFYGTIFDKNVRKILIKRIQKQNENVIGPNCSVCLNGEGEDHWLSACGHTTICGPCLKAESSPYCLECQTDINAVYKRSACFVCGNAEATCLHEECDHLDICEACASRRTRTSCLICGSNQGSKSLPIR
jgi:hypothetical protein